MNRHHIPRLSATERECLARIAGQAHADPKPCSQGTLARLLRLGLIEQVNLVWLPLEMKRVYYRVTSRGSQVLDHLRG